MIKKHTLDNGIRIVMEKIDYVRSASIGIWVNVGSNNENEETNGLSHFIEHMLFKGTKNIVSHGAVIEYYFRQLVMYKILW
jgi:predicted Zn-dependent peptidase